MMIGLRRNVSVLLIGRPIFSCRADGSPEKQLVNESVP